MVTSQDVDEAYETALRRFDLVQALEAELPLHHRCRSTLMTHGKSTDKAAVYFHGFTSCPAQGAALATRLAELEAQQLVDMANEAVDIAAGLGRKVFVIGLSAGGTVASWVAQNRTDVARVIAVSPFFAPFKLPYQAAEAASRMLLKIPNLVIRWNPLANVASEHVDYPFALPATHALAEIMLLGQDVQTRASNSPPGTRSISVLLNAADRSVSNAVTERLRRGG
jgi:pimeloyl-ACP methyl ester carboxylesterase